MSKKSKVKYDCTKPYYNIGTIGHVDHGKMTRASVRLEGKGVTVFKSYEQIDNHVEERIRGIIINAAQIDCSEDREYVKKMLTDPNDFGFGVSVIDYSGGRKYVKNMLTNDFVFVVSVIYGSQDHLVFAKDLSLQLNFFVILVVKFDINFFFEKEEFFFFRFFNNSSSFVKIKSRTLLKRIFLPFLKDFCLSLQSFWNYQSFNESKSSSLVMFSNDLSSVYTILGVITIVGLGYLAYKSPFFYMQKKILPKPPHQPQPGSKSKTSLNRLLNECFHPKKFDEQLTPQNVFDKLHEKQFICGRIKELEGLKDLSKPKMERVNEKIVFWNERLLEWESHQWESRKSFEALDLFKQIEIISKNY